jgi:hypothetical protein
VEEYLSEDVCAVYVIAVNPRNGPVKVGIARNPWQRLAQLQTGQPQALSITSLLSLPGRAFAIDIERAFHAVKKARRLRGEWFDFSPDEAHAVLYLAFGTYLDSLKGMSQAEIDETIALCLRRHPVLH